MKFFDIQNTREFYENILRCSGEIRQIEADGSERDLKAMAGWLIGSGMADRLKGIREIDLRIEQPSDADRLLRYALSMGRERICA